MSDRVQPLDGRRILIVEDEFLIAMEVKRWLQDAGAEVVGPVPGVEQALNLIDDGGIDAAVLDLNLAEGETAFPVADRLGELCVPHLFATGDVRVSRASGYDDRPRLEKPFMEAQLIRALVKLAASPHPTL